MQHWSDYLGPAIALVLAAVAKTLPRALQVWARSRLENRRLRARVDIAKHTHQDPGFVSEATPPRGTEIPAELRQKPEPLSPSTTHDTTDPGTETTPDTTTNPTGRKKSLVGGRRER